MFRSLVLLFGGMASLAAASLYAQDAVLEQKYGLGVHAYFAGDYQKASEELTAASSGGSKDARVYYFRGLAYFRLGRGPEATADFRKAASLESTDPNKFYNVAKSLERVQGAPRTELEKYRVQARMAVMQETERLRRARYEAIRREESRVVSPQALGPPEPLVPKAPAAEPPAEGESSDVFNLDEKAAAKPAAKAGKKPTIEEPPATEEEPAAEEEPAPKAKPVPAKKAGAAKKPADAKNEASPFEE